jgi:predicted AlkP superfamily phosphohydrolase/phosphomutase
MATLPASLWQEIIDSRSCSRNPTLYYPNQLRTGEAAGRPVTAADFEAKDSFWSIASRSGRRVAMLDLPYAHLDPDLNGLQLIEWGVHDAEFGYAAGPGSFGDEVAKLGAHPVSRKHNGRCDHYPKNTDGYLELLDDLLKGLELRTSLYTNVMRRETWDLFACGYTETHCAGHHFFHFHNAKHYAHDPNAPERLKDALFAIYRAVDSSIARLVEAAGGDVTILLFTPQGMQDFTGGYHMLPEILARLGLASDSGKGGQNNVIRKAQSFIKKLAPKSMVAPLRGLTKLGIVHRLQADAGCLLDPFTSPNTRAAVVPNNRIGAIRLNLTGREPFGGVKPNEAAALVADISAALLDLRDPKTNQPIVKSVMTAEEAFGQDHHPDVPDLLVEFRSDIGPLEECVSPRVGHVRVPFGKLMNERTGDHTTNAALYATGPAIARSRQMPQADILDIGPTVLSLLDVAAPNRLDGQAIDWIKVRHRANVQPTTR